MAVYKTLTCVCCIVQQWGTLDPSVDDLDVVTVGDSKGSQFWLDTDLISELVSNNSLSHSRSCTGLSSEHGTPQLTISSVLSKNNKTNLLSTTDVGLSSFTRRHSRDFHNGWTVYYCFFFTLSISNPRDLKITLCEEAGTVVSPPLGQNYYCYCYYFFKLLLLLFFIPLGVKIPRVKSKVKSKTISWSGHS